MATPQSNQWLGILKWSLQHHDGTGPQAPSTLSTADRNWLLKAMESGGVDDGVGVIKKALAEIAMHISAFEEFTYTASSMATATTVEVEVGEGRISTAESLDSVFTILETMGDMVDDIDQGERASSRHRLETKSFPFTRSLAHPPTHHPLTLSPNHSHRLPFVERHGALHQNTILLPTSQVPPLPPVHTMPSRSLPRPWHSRPEQRKNPKRHCHLPSRKQPNICCNLPLQSLHHPLPPPHNNQLHFSNDPRFRAPRRYLPLLSGAKLASGHCLLPPSRLPSSEAHEGDCIFHSGVGDV